MKPKGSDDPDNATKLNEIGVYLLEQVVRKLLTPLLRTRVFRT